MGNDNLGKKHEDNKWHAHKAVLDKEDCILSIMPDSETRIINKTIVLKETSVTSLSKVMTAELTEQDDRTCMSEVFDQDKSFLFSYRYAYVRAFCH